MMCPDLNSFGPWMMQAGLLWPSSGLGVQSHKHPQALQSDLLLRLTVSVHINFLDELMCSPRMLLPE